jgi:hypothetical protein
LAFFFSFPAFKAAALAFGLDFFDPDAVKSAVEKTTMAAVTLLWVTDNTLRQESVRIGLIFLVVLILHYLYKVHQRAWSRLRPNRPSETILPLFERADPPVGMYV